MMKAKRPKKLQIRKRWIVLAVAVLLLAVAGWVAYRYVQETTKAVITTNEGSVRTSRGVGDEVKRIDEPTFLFDLPVDWKKIDQPNAAYKGFAYQSAKKNAENRYLTVYVDNLPLNLPVNKVVAVRSGGSQLTYGQVSENCITFALEGVANKSQLVIPAKHDGVDFLCDNDTNTRNVIGTSAPNTINSVRLEGPQTGPHTYFITYEDNNYTPEYSILYTALDSFTAK